MNEEDYDLGDIDIAWCPGCGNYSILKILKKALAELNIKPQELVMVSGIGQAAKIPQYLKTHYFNGLHGRSIPPATAIKVMNPELTVIAESGDGCTYGEGGNHIIHAIRRNTDITNIVHNNMIYGLTKGQASPTSRFGFETSVQINGVILQPFNPVALAIAFDASFVARAFAGNIEQSKEILKKAIKHKGYSLVDIFQPCPTFNDLNTYKWFKDNTYYLDDSHDPQDKDSAFEKANEKDKLPLGVLYLNENKKTFEENQIVYKRDEKPLYKRSKDRIKNLQETKILETFK
ncbi:MAG: 2-oxoacid ferredoxin oxidoreductase [Candidatus Lokiarchaeota archaeon]|nr:2-oxoacid ferredoxin oxidoreductase [Candidatus Lokiarchaeota archaeon]